MKSLRSTALLVLAAGGSSRMGSPKQQLRFQGFSLLQRAILAGTRSKCQELFVVLGAHHEMLAKEIKPDQARVLVNPHWKEGLGSSICRGVEGLMQKHPPDQVILMLCDQPFVDENLLNQLITTQEETGKLIIACSYGDTWGVPALFDREFFPYLVQMKGEEGAKKLFHKFKEKLGLLPFPMGDFDVDTPEDYRVLLENNKFFHRKK